MKKTRGELIFQYFDIFLMCLLMVVIVFPVLNVISISVSNADAIINNRVTFYPIGFNTDAYVEIFDNATFMRSLINTIIVTVAGTFLSILMTLLVSYAMSREFPGKKIYTYFLVFTMYFGGGLIPTYIVFTRFLHLRNTYWVLFLPSIVNVFYIIVMRSQIEAMPQSVFEAAYIDGASELKVAFLITLPMISPTIAAISMFFALGYWNSWFNVMVYQDHDNMWTLQYFLRAVVFSKFMENSDLNTIATADATSIPAENIRMAAIVMTAAPIVAIYPFVQKYFVKGIIAGSVKG